KGQLIAFQQNENTERVTNNDRKIFFRYCYNNDISVCLNIYLTLVRISCKYLNSIKQHLHKHGLEEHIHRNTSRAPKNINRIEVNYNLVYDIYLFLKNYASIHGMPSPRRH